MRKGFLTSAGAAIVGSATAVTVLALGATVGHAEPGTSSAFGVLLDGAVPFGPEPTVESTDGTEQTEDLVNIPLGENGEIRAATLMAGDDVASVELAGVELTGDPGTITAEAVTVSCEGMTGDTTVADLNLDGTPVVIPGPDPNTEIDLSPAAKIVFNQQMTNADGTFTVNGLYIELLDTNEIITIGSATCGGPADGADDGGVDDGGADDSGADDGTADDGGADDSGADDGGDDGGPSAGKPGTVDGDLPVTG